MENPSPVEIPPEPPVEQHEPGAEAHDAIPTGYYYYDPALTDLYPGDNDQGVVPGWFYYDPSQPGGGFDWPYRGVPPRHMLYDASLYGGAADTTQPSEDAVGTAVETRGRAESEPSLQEPPPVTPERHEPAAEKQADTPVTESTAPSAAQAAPLSSPSLTTVSEPTITLPAAAQGTVSVPDRVQENVSAPVGTASPEILEPTRADVLAPDETVALSSFSFLGNLPPRAETPRGPETGPVRSDLLPSSQSPERDPIASPVPLVDLDAKKTAVLPDPVQPVPPAGIPEAVSERPIPVPNEPVASAQADLLPAESLQAPEVQPTPTVAPGPTAPAAVTMPVAAAQVDLLPAKSLRVPEAGLPSIPEPPAPAPTPAAINSAAPEAPTQENSPVFPPTASAPEPPKPSRPPGARLAPISRGTSMTIQTRPPMTPIRESARTLAVETEPGKLVLDTPPPPPGKVEAVPMHFQPRPAPARGYPRSRLTVPVLLAACFGSLALGYLGGFFTPGKGGAATNGANTGNGRPDAVGRQSVLRGDTPSPADALTKAQQSDLDKAFTASKAGNLPEARQLFVELQKKHPEWPSMSIEVGRINLYLKDLKAARDILTDASERGAMPADAAFLLGLLHMTNQSFPESEAAFGKAVALDPARPDFYYFWGECLRRDGKPLEAIDRFRAAMLRNQYETADGLYRLKYWLSKIQADQENTEDTAPQIDKGLKQARPAMEVLFAAAARSIKGKDYKTAADHIRRAQSYVEPSIYAVIMQDPTFAQESLRPELAEFYKQVAAPADPDAKAAAVPAASIAPSPTKAAASPGKGRTLP